MQKRFDAKAAKRAKRQAGELTEGQDDLAQLGWLSVDAEITELFERVVRPPNACSNTCWCSACAAPADTLPSGQIVAP